MVSYALRHVSNERFFDENEISFCARGAGGVSKEKKDETPRRRAQRANYAPYTKEDLSRLRFPRCVRLTYVNMD